jgi:hypothetical protein
MRFKICMLFIFSFLSQLTFAEESNKVFNKAFFYSSLQNEPKPHSPHKASVLSAIFPGAGQAYNKKYWKMPIIYLGMGGLTFSIISNSKKFQSFQSELGARANQDTLSFNPKYANYPNSYLTSSRDFHRNNRDLSIVGLVAIYALNIVDATVDAHLYNFDVDRSLSLRAKPIQTMENGRINTGVSLGLCFGF